MKDYAILTCMKICENHFIEFKKNTILNFILFIIFSAKSLPLHCVVESVPSLQASYQLDARSPWRRRPNIETDSYVIVPAATPFCDIVTIALQRLGYSSDISNTAKGNTNVKYLYFKILNVSFLLFRSHHNQKLEATSIR